MTAKKKISKLGTLLALIALGALALNTFGEGQEKVSVMEEKKSNNAATELATFGAGCFWGVEETYREVKGVVGTAVGYMGGAVTEPTYKQVCTDTTGHAEVTQVEFDPALTSYEELLEVFWKVHDPTHVNRQGPDVGAQYRTAIFYHSAEQKAAAEKSLAALSASGKYTKPIATEITPAAEFWRAEEYHQRYLQKRGLPACKLY